MLWQSSWAQILPGSCSRCHFFVDFFKNFLFYFQAGIIFQRMSVSNGVWIPAWKITSLEAPAGAWSASHCVSGGVKGTLSNPLLLSGSFTNAARSQPSPQMFQIVQIEFGRKRQNRFAVFGWHFRGWSCCGVYFGQEKVNKRRVLGKVSLPMVGGWNKAIFKVISHLNRSMIMWFTSSWEGPCSCTSDTLLEKPPWPWGWD